MKKRKTSAKLSQDAAVLLQKLRRMEEADEHGMVECITCGYRSHWKKMQGGHWIPRVHAFSRLAEWNVNPQCYGCNVTRHGCLDRYTTWMIDRHGREWVDEQIRRKGDPWKWDRSWVEGKMADFKRRIKELEKEMG